MPQPSHRISTLNDGGRDGWELYRRAKAMRARGLPVVELTIGEHDVPTDPAILAAMDASARGGHVGYSAIPGLPELRAAIAERTERVTGVPTGPDNVVVTSGGQGALFAAHLLVGDAGDRALFVDPYYATYPGTIRSTGLVPVPVTARPEAGFEPAEADMMAAAPGARSLLVNSPNNPTGVVYGRPTIEAIARVAAAHDLWVVSDEVYDSQVWDGEHLSPRALPGMIGRTLVIGSLSKSHAMTGSRLGWIVGPEDAVARLWDLATCTNYGIPGYIQDAGAFALSLGPAYEARIGEPFRRRRDIVRRLVAGQGVVRLVPQRGAMYAMLDVRATGLTAETFAERLLDEEGVAVMPGDSFGPGAAGHVRVAMTVEDRAFEEALARLLRFAARHARGVAA